MVMFETRPSHDATGAPAPRPSMLVVTEEDAGRLSPLVRAIEAHGVRVEVVPPRPWLLDDGHVLLLRATVADDAMRPLDGFHELRPLEIRGDAVMNRPGGAAGRPPRAAARQRPEADGVAHVRTLGCFDAEGAVEMAFAVGFPVVLRPAYGRGGRGMVECADADELCHRVDELTRAAGRTAPGLAVQERIVAPADVHVLVAGDEVAGASLQLPAEGTRAAGVGADGHRRGDLGAARWPPCAPWAAT